MSSAAQSDRCWLPPRYAPNGPSLVQWRGKPRSASVYNRAGWYEEVTEADQLNDPKYDLLDFEKIAIIDWLLNRSRPRLRLDRQFTRYNTEPHGRCSRAGRCVERDVDQNVEPCIL